MHLEVGDRRPRPDPNPGYFSAWITKIRSHIAAELRCISIRLGSVLVRYEVCRHEAHMTFRKDVRSGERCGVSRDLSEFGRQAVDGAMAADGFCLAMSYNPGYPSALKGLKQSTRQRFVVLEFDYREAELERQIICRESGVDDEMEERLVKFAHMTRNLKGQGLDEGRRPVCWSMRPNSSQAASILSWPAGLGLLRLWPTIAICSVRSMSCRRCFDCDDMSWSVSKPATIHQ